jgi:uncharacterized protein
VRFEWDDWKNARNFRKHGVTFELAAVVFDDPMHITEIDRVEDGEIRWRTIGEVHGKYLLLVAHLLDEDEDAPDEEIVRIISAREATPHERREYEGGL